MPPDAAAEEAPLKEWQAAVCKRFRETHPDLFRKKDALLFLHLTIVFLFLGVSTEVVILTPHVGFKILLGAANMFLWLSLVDATIHHHHTHHNAAHHAFAQKAVDLLYVLLVPAASRRRERHVVVHLNHYAHTLEPTDIDHLYGIQRFLRMKKDLWQRSLYFLEMTFIGGHVPGWEDARYATSVPVMQWNLADYEKVKKGETERARKIAVLHWGLFAVTVYAFPWFAWGWIFPFLFLRNWVHYLGQFQHYDERLLGAGRTIGSRAKTFCFSGGLNYLLAGEISGHFLHHLFPALPYYRVEQARKLFVNDPEAVRLFVTY